MDDENNYSLDGKLTCCMFNVFMICSTLALRLAFSLFNSSISDSLALRLAFSLLNLAISDSLLLSLLAEVDA
jgi:hypothetical protein